MKKALQRKEYKIYHYQNGIKKEGAPSGIRGDLSGISGNLSGISGDLTRISGDLSGIRGDLDDCEITAGNRKKRN